MARRLPSTPPTLPGFTFVRVLGAGGFADVFLYEQNMPRRQVAVKVLLAEVVTPRLRRMFEAEANVMARLSAHPSILTIHQAGVSADGRPYLVMELCSPVLGLRRGAPLAVPDALRIGVQIAGAVQTAHDSGVLHRDIKPTNILMTAYGHPVLSDFGIAAAVGAAESPEGVGLSVPWSAPEVVLDETAGTVASEVYALAATLYTLLAGRSPFEPVEGTASGAELVTRITRGRPGALGREDVPASLERLLVAALSRRPASRPVSAAELARGLQAVETELGLGQTPLETRTAAWAEESAADPAERTRLTAVPSVAGREGRRTRSARPVPDVEPVPAARPRPRGVTALAAAVAALVVVLVGAGVVVAIGSGRQTTLPRVSDVAADPVSGAVRFSWEDPGITAGDQYQVTVGDDAPSLQRTRSFTVDAAGSAPVCVVVAVAREGRVGPPSAEKCAEPESP